MYKKNRDVLKKGTVDYLESRLLGDINVISDTHIVEDWNEIRCVRSNRNTIAKYVGANCDIISLKEGKSRKIMLY